MGDWRPLAYSTRMRLSRTRLYRAAMFRLTPDILAIPGEEGERDARFANISVPADIVVYFHDGLDRLYQMEQWMPVFEQLAERHRLLIATRSLASFRQLAATTSIPIVFLRRLQDVEEALERTDPKLCLYVNNASGNFHVLSWRRALHVHLNHGESDKLSMSSNQAKAYDAVLVAGEAAELRYKEALLGFSGETLIRVGRPQLDLAFEDRLPASDLKTVLYAPTWEGATAGMNYTSVPAFGPALVRSLVGHGGFRVVYKPHPRIPTGSPFVAAAHGEIIRILGEASAGRPPGQRHVVELEAPILSLFPSADAMIADVSSVAIDWLFLRTDAPLWICDPRDDRAGLYRESPLAARTYVLDTGVMPAVAGHVAEVVDKDPRRLEREEVRRLYFGDLGPGESTRRFLETMDDLVARRDVLLAAKRDAAGAADTPIVVG